MLILGLTLQFAAFLCLISILRRSYDDSRAQGLLSTLLPPYALYYMFMKLQGKPKALLITGFLGGAILGLACILLAAPRT